MIKLTPRVLFDFKRSLHTKNRFRVAIVGAGPAGFFCAERLLKYMDNCHIDIYERLPAPFGLARYGVAPDHEDVKNCINRFRDVLQNDNVSFFGNVSIPAHIPLHKLHENYHATVLSYGATAERMLDIPGEELESVIDATSFVGWYNGHPDMYNVHFNFANKTSAVIVGNGNVSLDIARMLFKDPLLLKSTDITSCALKKLSESRIRDLYIIGRRGPLQSSFTSKELREICTLPGVNIHIDSVAFNQALEAQQHLLLNRPLKRLMEIFMKATQRPHSQNFKNIHFLFNQSPTAIFSSGSNLSHIELSKNTIDPGTSRIIASEPCPDLKCDILFRSIGYMTEALARNSFPSTQPILIHDARSNSLRNINGRIVDMNDQHIKGLYTAGWLKSGPVGVIASTMYNAQETADYIMKDVQQDKTPFASKHGRFWISFMNREANTRPKKTDERDENGESDESKGTAERYESEETKENELITESKVITESEVSEESVVKQVTHGWGGIVREWNWENIDRAEVDAGTALGKVREKVVRWDRLLSVGREVTVTDDAFKDEKEDEHDDEDVCSL